MRYGDTPEAEHHLEFEAVAKPPQYDLIVIDEAHWFMD